ncbi:MAG: cytochrome c1 [Pseudomonadota bacterium]|nr:cytochrome c1 [Pseudomonadota bacterium]
MIRKIGPLVGIGIVFVLLLSLFSGLKGYFDAPPEETVEHEFYKKPQELHLASNGPLGHFDRQQLQRGFQVYKEVCAACHGLNLVAFRDLAALGYEEPEIKAIANQWAIEVPSVNPDTGEAATRKAVAADRFPSPYPNDTAARAANNNALPPDLSLIAKAREDGPAYVRSLLAGYSAQPAELLKKYPSAKTPPGLYYNRYFPNLNIAMPPPITSEGQVTYADGTKATVDQMSTDVAAFLTWTAEPKLENRHRWGLVVLTFLLFATILGYMSYRNIWASAKRKVAPVGVLDPANIAQSNQMKDEEGIAG